MPKVTVVLPVYNGQKYVHECLDSLISQSFPDWEAICVNDGSTDQTLSILQAYATKDPRIYVIDKPNSGYGDSVNRGIDAARGKYVTILESDDLLPNYALGEMYSFVVDNGMLDFAKADTKSFIGVNDRTFAYERISQLDKCYTEVFNPSENPGAYLTRPSQPGMYSLEYLNHYGIRHNTSPGASYQDAGFWAQNMFCAQKVRYLAKDCYWVRRDNEASSELDTSKLFTICDEFAFVYRRIGEIDGINKEACYRAISKFAASSYDWNLFRLKDEDRKPFIARYSKDFNVLASRNQIDWSLFDEYETNILKMIIEHPDAYYYRQFFFAKDFDDSYQVIQQQNATIDKLKQENAALRQELENVYQSKRYKIGSKIAHLGGR